MLQTIRRLLIRFRCFRLERELAGPDFHRVELCTFIKAHITTAPREVSDPSWLVAITGFFMGATKADEPEPY